MKKPITGLFKTIAIASFVPMALILQGCALFGGDGETAPLPGERMTILQIEEQLEPDPVLQTSQIDLPEAWNNQYWPQYGGYPNHAMGHVALAANLTPGWSADIGQGVTATKPLLSMPIVVDNVVFTMSSDLRLSAFNATNGQRLWHIDLPVDRDVRRGALGGGIAHADGRLYATTGLNVAFIINPQNGEVLHRLSLPTASRNAPSAMDGQLYIQTLDGRLNAYNAETGESMWHYSGFSETTSLLGGPAPAVNRDIVVAGFSSGDVVALRNLNGQTLWSDSLASVRPVSALSSIADIRGAVVLDKGLAYAISYNGRIVAIDIPSGRRVWQREIGGTQTPWPAGNVVYVLTNNRELVALSRLDGRIFWVENLPRGNMDEANLWYGPVFAGNRLVMISNAGQVQERNPTTGALEKEWNIRGTPAGAPIVANNKMFIVTREGRLQTYGAQ